MPRANDLSSSDTDRSTIISNGICVEATMNVMKNSRIKNGNMVLQGLWHRPAVATGITVTSWKLTSELSA